YGDTGLAAGNQYSYRVCATNTAGDSAFSNTASATTTSATQPPAGPVAPSNLTATDVNANRIKLYWTDNSSDETGFKIERAVGNGAFVQIATVRANVTSYTDKRLTGGTTYTYRVRATNASGD